MPESLFNKVVGLVPVTSLKRDSGIGVFLWILRNFQKHLFYRTPLALLLLTNEYSQSVSYFLLQHYFSECMFLFVFCLFYCWFFDFTCVLLILYNYQKYNVITKRKSLKDLNITRVFILATFDLKHWIQYLQIFCKKNKRSSSKRKLEKALITTDLSLRDQFP